MLVLAAPTSAVADHDGNPGRIGGGVRGFGHEVLCSELGSSNRAEIVGHLVVAPGSRCDLSRSTVTGTVLVGLAGSLRMDRSTVQGDVVLQYATSAAVTRSLVNGNVRLLGPEIDVSVVSSTLRRGVRGSAGSLYVENARVDGAINVTSSGDVTISQTTVAGWISLRGGQSRAWRLLGGEITRVGSGGSVGSGVSALSSASTPSGGVGSPSGRVSVEWSTAARVTSDGARQVRVCGTDIVGDLTVTRAPEGLGLGFADYGDGLCDRARLRPWHVRHAWAPDQRDAVTVGGSVLIADVPGPVVVRRTTILGDLTCPGPASATLTVARGSAPAVLDLAGVAVGGNRLGRCA
ncbi:hypothetical protein [Cellulomonas fimi]|uniref:Uncharacterized protein n=1 Tax=Cellulomonas fimi TaxID=1708 RepID=A0A7Y0LXQ2_CELFI|nr:hypothetical protein [Cellulomonas fimi]NMR19975.1 hypothetical protein [Cellulomonas fimi]